MTGLSSWRRVWDDLGARTANEDLHRRLLACWGEGHRRYHNVQHLGECLDTFDAVRTQARHPGEVALALWFHDAVYDPQRHDNEERSAHWARTSALEAGVAADSAERIHAMVMATRHEAVPQDADTRLLVDVDLSILGAEPGRFDESDLQIRAEYAHVPEPEYRAGRRRILGGFLARPRLYGTEHFHSLLEQRARNNLMRALARLQD